VIRELDLDPDARNLVVDALASVVNEVGGTRTGRGSGREDRRKTGTAQVVAIGKTRLKKEAMTYWQRDHAWFASFAPAEDPEIAVVVLNEHAGHGGNEAAPTASALIKKYFELKREDANATIAAPPLSRDAGATGASASRSGAASAPGAGGSAGAGGFPVGGPGALGPLGGRALMLLRVERRMVLKVPWGLVAVTVAIALLGIWNLASARGRRTRRCGRGSC
jgi:penicillin-binding protein 2